MDPAGGVVLVRHYAVLSGVWAAACIAGVTPLFFIFGTPVKMALLAFYSFAIFGSTGGCITGWVVGDVFGGRLEHRVKYVLSWAVSLGFAALAVNPASAILKMIFPPPNSFRGATGSITC